MASFWPESPHQLSPNILNHVVPMSSRLHPEPVKSNNEVKQQSLRPVWIRKWLPIDILRVAIFTCTHIISLGAPFHFTWPAFWTFVALYIITGMLGVTLSFHRHLSHRSFSLPKWLEYTFAYCGVLAVQGNPMDWVSTHRYHHKYTDSLKDPHSPVEGFLFSHVYWIADRYYLTSKCGDPNNVGDLRKQVFYRFIEKTYYLHALAPFPLLYVYGGLPFIVWGGGIRTILMWHSTFSLNSVCHMWGKRAWNTSDQSRNNWWIAILTFGEGWHNNHHAFKSSARHGLEWWEVDMTWGVIRLLKGFGLAADVKVPTEGQKKRMEIRADS